MASGGLVEGLRSGHRVSVCVRLPPTLCGTISWWLFMIVFAVLYPYLLACVNLELIDYGGDREACDHHGKHAEQFEGYSSRASSSRNCCLEFM